MQHRLQIRAEETAQVALTGSSETKSTFMPENVKL